MSQSVKRAAQFLARRPLQLVTAPFRHWSEQRLQLRQMQEAQRQIAEVAGEELAKFHTMLWSQWPDVVQHVRQRQHTHRGERP